MTSTPIDTALECRPCELEAEPQQEDQPARRLFARRWGPTEASHVVVVVHGLGEHGGCYEPFAHQAANAGIATLIHDQHGHGLSPGQRGTVSEFDVFMQDIGLAMEAAAEIWPDRPRVLLAHSMGGNFALRYCMEPIFGPQPNRLVLTNPMIMPPASPSRDQVFAAWLTGKILPNFRITSKIDPTQLTSDTEAVKEILRDPLMHHKMQLEIGTQLVTQGQWIMDHPIWLKLPTLMLLGESDELTDQQASREFAEKAQSVCELKSYSQLKHNLLRETKRVEIVGKILDWISSSNHVTETNPTE